MPENERHRLHRDLTGLVAASGLIGYGHAIDLKGCRAVAPSVMQEFPDMPYYDCFLKTVIKLSEFAAHFVPCGKGRVYLRPAPGNAIQCRAPLPVDDGL